MKVIFASFINLLLLMTLASCGTKQKADLVLFNGKVYTANNHFDTVSAVAVKNGKVLAVGTTEEIMSEYDGRGVDLHGNALYPGFNDGHSHFLGYGVWVTRYANLVGTQSFDEVLNVLKHFDKNGDKKWILGRGWDQNDWQNSGYPNKSALDVLFPEKPVVLTRIDGHAVLANSVALRIAGLDKDTVIEGGEVVLKNGEPTGVLIDHAADLMKEKVPPLTVLEKTEALQRAQSDCLAAGLTTVTDAGLDKGDILLIDSLQESGLLTIKVYAMMNPTEENFSYFFPLGPLHKSRITVGAVKLYADGALGSRGALLLKPYSDMPGHYGLQLHPQSYFDSICKKAYDAGFQVNTHAIGDSGNRIVLKTYARILKGKNDLRWRIEHAQVIAPADFHFFGQYNIIPSIQSTHCTSDMYWAEKRLGKERIQYAYAYKKLLDENGWVVNGTDFPIEEINPIKTFYAAVTRKDKNGWPPGGFHSENAFTREEALRSITVWPAKGSFDGGRKGTIEVGKDADFVLLDRDIMTCPVQEILKANVLNVWINGQTVYKSNNPDRAD